MKNFLLAKLILAQVLYASLQSVDSKTLHTDLGPNSVTLDLENPCGESSGGKPQLTVVLREQIREMKERSEGLLLKSEKVQQIIESQRLLTGLPLSFVKNPPAEYKYYFEEENVTRTVEMEHNSISDPIETLQSHANLVAEMTLHVDYALKSGDLEVYGDHVLVKQVTALKASFLDLMCDIHIALRSQNSDLAPFVPELNDKFISEIQPGLVDEYSRMFLFMNDGQRLTGFLHDMYGHMEFYLPA